MNGKRNGSFHKILVGYDGSQESERALELALAIANTMDSKVEVLAVAQPSEPPTAVQMQAVIDDAREHYDKALRRIADAAKENGIEIETAVAVGHPAEQIIRQAERGLADLIVVGRRGLSALEKMVMGSVSERVLRYAPCPVLVTR
jgi:nucleotide-binding universal stress UspA family protein